MKNQFIACTATSSSYFPQCVNLIGSILLHHPSQLSKFVVYDLGMTDAQIRFLEKINRVHIGVIKPFCSHYKAWFAWKPWVIRDCLDHHAGQLPVIYMDSGMQAQKSLAPLIEMIYSMGYFFIDASPHKTRDYTTGYLYSRLGINQSLDDTTIIMATLQGYHPESPVRNLLCQAVDLSQDERALRPSADCLNNRHDQSIFSLLLRYFYTDFQVMPFEGNPIVAWEMDEPERIRNCCLWLCRGRGVGQHDSHLFSQSTRQSSSQPTSDCLPYIF
jgi:hypothetical protein